SLTAHGVVPGAKRTADNQGNLRHYRIRYRVHHLRSSFDDAAPLGVTAYHEAIDIMKKDQRNQILVAVHDEARSLLGGFGINHSAKFHALMAFMVCLLRVQFLIGDDPDCEPSNPRISTNNGLAIFRLVFVKRAAIDNTPDNFLHVIRTSG